MESISKKSGTQSDSGLKAFQCRNSARRQKKRNWIQFAEDVCIGQRNKIKEMVGVHVANEDRSNVGHGTNRPQDAYDPMPALEQQSVLVVFNDVSRTGATGVWHGWTRAKYR